MNSCEHDYAAWIGIDWADQKHAWAMQVDGERRLQSGVLEHTPEAIENFFAGLAARFPGRRIAVALEQSRGALIFMLTKYEHLVLYPIHPATLDHYRKGLYPSGAKSDPSDAALILERASQAPRAPAAISTGYGRDAHIAISHRSPPRRGR